MSEETKPFDISVLVKAELQPETVLEKIPLRVCRVAGDIVLSNELEVTNTRLSPVPDYIKYNELVKEEHKTVVDLVIDPPRTYEFFERSFHLTRSNGGVAFVLMNILNIAPGHLISGVSLQENQPLQKVFDAFKGRHGRSRMDPTYNTLIDGEMYYGYRPNLRLLNKNSGVQHSADSRAETRSEAQKTEIVYPRFSLSKHNSLIDATAYASISNLTELNQATTETARRMGTASNTLVILKDDSARFNGVDVRKDPFSVQLWNRLLRTYRQEPATLDELFVNERFGKDRRVNAEKSIKELETAGALVCIPIDGTEKIVLKPIIITDKRPNRGK